MTGTQSPTCFDISEFERIRTAVCNKSITLEKLPRGILSFLERQYFL